MSLVLISLLLLRLLFLLFVRDSLIFRLGECFEGVEVWWLRLREVMEIGSLVGIEKKLGGVWWSLMS